MLLLLLALATTPAQAEEKVREALGSLEKSLTSKDESVSELVDLSRLVKEMERRGSIPEGTADGFRNRGMRRLEDNLSTVVSAPGSLGGGWERIQPLSVRLNPAGNEAEAFCRVTIGGKPAKFRFWLNRSGDTWRTFDYENLDGTYRLSVIGMQYAPGVDDDEDKNSLRDGVMTLQRGAVHLAKGQPAGAREALSMARRSEPPPYVMDWIELTDGLAMSAMGDAKGGLKAADRVLARQKDMAVAYRLKATCHVALGEPAKAIQAAKEYLRIVGDDPDMWTLVGDASRKLGQPEEAAEAYRKAAASDPGDVTSRSRLVALLVAGGKQDEALQALRTLLDRHPECHAEAAKGKELEEFRKLPAVQEMLSAARAKAGK